MTNIFLPLNPIRRCCKLLTVWPYSGVFSLNSVDIYYRILIFSMNIYATNDTLKYFISQQAATTTIIWVSQLICSSVYLLLQVTVFLGGLLNKKQMENIMSQFVLVEQELLEMGSESNIKRSHVLQCIVIAVSITLHLPNLYLYWLLDGLKLKIFIYSFSNIQNEFVPLMVTCLAHVIMCRFRSINSQLISVLKEAPTTPSYVILNKLRKLINIHTNLRSIIQGVNTTFSLYTLIYLGYTVLGGAVILLILLKNIKSESSMSFMEIYWIFFIIKTLLVVLLLTEQCHTTALEVCLLLI